MPRYVYAIVPDSVQAAVPTDGIGNAPVEWVRRGSIAAVVSSIPEPRLRPQRRNLQAHQKVLTALFEVAGTPLPFAFGTVVPDEQELLAMLDRHQDVFLAQLARVHGAREYALRVRLDSSDVFAWFLRHTPELAALRDRTFAGGTPSQDALIRLGQAFDEARGQTREQVADQVIHALGPASTEVKVHPTKGEADLVDLAALVQQRPRLDDAIHKLAGELHDDFIIEVTGPWAPYSFVDLQVA